MFKYDMIIDNERYVALFENHIEATDFLDEAEADGSVIIINNIKAVNVKDIIEDNDFEDIYKIEMISIMVLPNHRDFKKYDALEKELNKIGIVI